MESKDKSHRIRRKALSRAIAEGTNIAFKDVLTHFGVGGLAASIASHFVFRFIFKPMLRHFLKHHVLNSYSDHKNSMHFYNTQNKTFNRVDKK